MVKSTEKIQLKISGDRTIYAELETWQVDNLKLDIKNPRYAHEKRTFTDEEMEERIWKEPESKQLYRSILASKGLSEQPFIRSDGRVQEGNRRLVCLRRAKRALEKGELEKEYPDIKPGTFNTIQVIKLPDDIPESEIDVLLARFHVSGKKEWEAIDQAEHIFRLNNIHTKSFEVIAELIGKSKGWVYQKWWAYNETQSYLKDRPLGNISQYSYFEELFKKKKIKEKYDSDTKFRKEFQDWIVSNKFDDTGSKDVRVLPDIMSDQNAFGVFKTQGMKQAKIELAKSRPEYESVTFQSVQDTIESLRNIPRSEYKSIKDNPAQISLLKELKLEISEILKELNITEE
jgi:hypothetical protein